MIEINSVIREHLISKTVIKVTSNGVNTVGCPVGVYMNSAGKLYGIKVALDVNSIKGRYGIALNTTAADEEVLVQIAGECTVTSGGTANQVVTAISNAGAITDAAVSNANADINILGVSTGTTKFIIA